MKNFIVKINLILFIQYRNTKYKYFTIKNYKNICLREQENHSNFSINIFRLTALL